MQPAELTVENAEMSTSLGAGFWTGWAAGMAATLGAFAGAVYLLSLIHNGRCRRIERLYPRGAA